MAEIKGTLERRKTSRWWYGSYRIDGRRKAVNLRVEVRGRPPAPDEEHGSVQFEKSRTEAGIVLKAMLAEVNGGRKTEELAQAVHEARSGRKVEAYLLADLSRLWLEKPRNKPVVESHRKRCVGILGEFGEWCGKHFPKVTKLDHISPEVARTFMDWHEQRGISPRTWNFILGTMRAACRRGGCKAFDEMPQKQLETVHRIPFTPEELQAIMEEAEADKLLYPLVVTAACTAMRKGDCCLLLWDAVDMEGGFITVKTSKTGRAVDIPMADLLRTEIQKQKGNGSKYVYPDLAELYRRNPDELTKRFKRVLFRAGFHDGKTPPTELAPYDPQELANKAMNYFRNIPTKQKREKARAVFRHYTNGKAICESAERAGVSKATASAYLNEIESETGIAFIRGKRREPDVALPPSRGAVRVERTTGLKRASVRDFHALRTTWITLALMQGMPLELVQTVTGHATAEIVMQHYFKPQREHLKKAMYKAMPSLLTNSAQLTSPSEQALKKLKLVNSGMDKKNIVKLVHEAVKLLDHG